MSADAQPDLLDVRFPTRRILAIIGDKWTTVVLYCLSIREHRRFNELQKQIPDISEKMLIQTLRNLERDGLLERTVYPQVPPKTEYRLTDNGHKLREPIAWLCEWGMENCGDQVHGLIGVVSYPANWRLASLPKALSSAEVERLLGSLGHDGPSARPSDAMVRCALDLGLRGSEVAKLGLDDIDWRAGIITLRRTKSRREDILPLPEATGRAIADYLKFERPQTTNRSVFVRHVAPRGQPIGPDLVRKVIRQAYARAGLPYTRAHLLRHTMASRLLEGGSSLKEVADVLRHRSLNTTLIYAKLDNKNLAAVALPWPGCAA